MTRSHVIDSRHNHLSNNRDRHEIYTREKSVTNGSDRHITVNRDSVISHRHDSLKPHIRHSHTTKSNGNKSTISHDNHEDSNVTTNYLRKPSVSRPNISKKTVISVPPGILRDKSKSYKKRNTKTSSETNPVIDGSGLRTVIVQFQPSQTSKEFGGLWSPVFAPSKIQSHLH